MSWRIPAPTVSSQMGTLRGLRTPAELSPQPSFPTTPPPVFILQLRHFLPVVRPWWSASAPFTSPAASAAAGSAAAAAASAKDKAEARAAAAAKANASVMTRAVDWLRQSLAATTSAKDKAEASAAAAAKANASAMNRAVDWLRQSAAASAVAPAAVSAPAPNLQPNQWGRLCCRSAVPNAQQL